MPVKNSGMESIQLCFLGSKLPRFLSCNIITRGFGTQLILGELLAKQFSGFWITFSLVYCEMPLDRGVWSTEKSEGLGAEPPGKFVETTPSRLSEKEQRHF